MTNEVSAPVEQVQAPQAAPVPIFTQADMEKVRQDTARQSFQAGYGKAQKEMTPATPVQSIDPNQGMYAPQNQAMQQPQMQQQAVQPQATPEMQAMIAQQLQAHLAQQQQMMEQQQQQRVAQEGAARLDAQLMQNKDKYPDMDNLLANAKFDKFRNVVGLASDNSIPNGADVIYHLAQNPIKKAQLHDLANTDLMGAITETRRLAQSLQTNEAASNLPNTREPLSQLTPSSPGVSSGAPLSLAEKKRLLRY